MHQKEYFGLNSIINLKKILSKYKPKSIFLVTGKNSYEKCGAKSILDKILKGYNVIHFYDFDVNPKLLDIKKGIKLFKKNKCDFIIAIGGGSVMDVAKSVNSFAANDGKPEDYLQKGKSIEKKGKVLVAIPTTAGSGSEATKFAVIYLNKTKYSLDNEFIIPDYAIIDPQFIMNLQKSITSSAGMDALSQGIESYWSVHSTNQSKKYSRGAIKLAIRNLAKAVNGNKSSRIAMAKAAHLAGKAINISKTTACHAISYPITSYFNVPHGHAVALTIPSMLKYNLDINENDMIDKRGVKYVKKTINEIVKLLGYANVNDASIKIQNLMKQIGLSTKLSELGIKTNEDIEIIIKNGFNPGRVRNNPRLLTEQALRKILEDIR
ncbi:phosphonoacetaldehyde reductase [Candidatus Woesearchaeota archaeon]|nr:phosphonoacetaldehyde reductase [Candidatus Woesearchaeota archaeon]